MSIAAAAAPLLEGEAATAGTFGRTANFLSGAHGVQQTHLHIPVPRDAPAGTPDTLAKSTINPGSVVA